MLDLTEHAETIKRIQEFCLMDDTFMSKVFENNIATCELLLHIILKNDKLKVKGVRAQYELKNLVGRSSKLDIWVEDENGNFFNVEVQRSDSGAIPRRARYHSSLVDMNIIKAGEEYRVLPDTYVIFITEHDVLKGSLPLYTIHRTIDQLNTSFDDGSHIIYVNSEIKDNTALGKLMQDFYEKDPNKMNYKELATQAKFFKYTEEGQEEMCRIVEEIAAKREAKAIHKEKIEIALMLIAEGDSIEKVAKVTKLPYEKVLELAQPQSA